jgi:hypothetical protein
MVLFGLQGFANNSSYQEIELIMSVDWEGFSLEPHNLKAFRDFRNDFPQIKMVHFLNAAYFIGDNVNRAKVKKEIKSVLRPGDELGLHVHALEPLLKAAAVPFRDQETFWGYEHSQPVNGIRGHDVPLTLFSLDEIRKIVRTSLSILSDNGFNGIQSFRAGGWSANQIVLEALVLEGIFVDSSAVSPEIVKYGIGENMPLFKNIVSKLWPGVNIHTNKPFVINTPSGSITEIPNNIGLADYIDGNTTFSIFKNFMTAIDLDNGEKPLFHFGFHQETAAAFLPEVRIALNKIFQYIESYRVSLASKTFVELKTDASPSISCQSIGL